MQPLDRGFLEFRVLLARFGERFQAASPLEPIHQPKFDSTGGWRLGTHPCLFTGEKWLFLEVNPWINQLLDFQIPVLFRG